MLFCTGVRLAGQGGDYIAFDAAFVLPAEDAEIAILAPIVVPRVADEPIRGPILCSIPNDRDRMATKERTRVVLIHASFVRLEVRVHREGSLDGAVINKLLHNVLHARDGVGAVAELLVLIVDDGGIGAGANALGG